MPSESPDTVLPSAVARYSARVRINLHLNGQVYHVAQIGGGRLFFDSPITFEESTGTVIITVDDHEERWHVTVPSQPVPSRIITAQLKPE